MSDSKDEKREVKDEKREGKEVHDEVKGLDDAVADDFLKLLRPVSQELEKITVAKKVALVSELVKTMAEGDKEEKEIPLPNVKMSVLKQVITYMTYHVAT